MFWLTIVTSPTLDNPEPSLQHWPAVAAWWSSRACIQGPSGELCDVVYFPISQASGLHLVHPTWAGTFLLAALCLVFPGLHIVLLDSDCVPVTLFEVEDLRQEAQRLQHSGFPGPVPTSSCAGGLNLDQVDQSTQRHCVVALFPSLVVGCMFTSELKMQW